jgi:hypothetical protein
LDFARGDERVQERVYARFLWVVAATIGTVLVVMVASATRAGSVQSAPTTQVPCQPDQVMIVRVNPGDQPPRQTYGPTDGLVGHALSTATSVRRDLRLPREYRLGLRGADGSDPLSSFSILSYSNPGDSTPRQFVTVLECGS